MGKYKNYTAAFKLQVIVFAENRGNRAAEREFSVSEKLVRDWRKQKVSLKNTNLSRRAFRGPKTGMFPVIDEEVLGFVKELRNNGCSISYEMLQLKAREVARKNNIPLTQFKASRGWVMRFMRRNNMAMRRRTTICQKLPANYTEKVVSFHRYVLRMRQETAFLLSQIGNADQTPVFFDMPRNSTIAMKGESSIPMRTTGNEKLRCTVMLAITADGRKLPPYIIFKRKTIPKGVQFPRGIHVRVQTKGWMDFPLMVDWIKTVWNVRPGALLKQPAMLVLDSFRGHLVNEVKQLLKDNKTQQVVIPGGLTSILQPLDVCINKPFKDHLRRFYNEWMMRKDRPLTPAGNIKRPSLELLCTWVLNSWNLITQEMVAKSFKKTGISNALDSTEDDALWRDEGETSDASSAENDSSETGSGDDGPEFSN